MRGWLRQLPNFISSLRILLIVPIAWALLRHQLHTTLWLFGAAAASDAVDGFLAKQFDWRTELGGILDPLADKLMLSTVFIVLTLLGSVPVWLTTAVIARDCIIVLGAVSYRVLLGPVAARPSNVSKLNTLCQIIYLLVVIGVQLFAWPGVWTMALGALVFVTAAVSGIDYVWVYGRQAVAQAKLRHADVGAGGSKPA
jgi:cardiolipin synthase